MDYQDTKIPEGLTLKTHIPDHSVVQSQMSVLDQRVFVSHQDFLDNIEWFRQLPDDGNLIKKAALHTMHNLSGEHHDQWEDTMAKEDRLYSLKECMQEKVCTCFHRSIFFNLLMDQRGISCVTLDGRVIETQNKKIADNEKTAPLLAKNALNVEEGAFEDGHVWNVAEVIGNYYLVDSAFLIDGKPVIVPIDFDNDTRNTFTVQLPDGRYRHYLSSGTIRTHTFDETAS